MTWRLPAATLLVLTCLAACTSTDPAPSTDAPPPSASRDAGPGTTEPLVLVSAVNRRTVRLDLDSARSVLHGRSKSWSVAAAPGLPTTRVRVVASAAAARLWVTRHPRRLAVLAASDVGPTVRPVLIDGVHPIRDPDDYPLTVPGPTPGSVTRLTVVGDVMLSRGVRDPAAALRPMAARLAGADITVGNLESTLSANGSPQQGGDSFAADPSVVPLLEGAGLDALSLANNHVGDYQEAALLETVRRLRSSAIRPFGAGRNLAAASRPATVQHGGIRFGFVAFNSIGETPQATRDRAGALSVRMPPRTGPLDEGDLRHVVGVIRRLDRRVDVVVVLPHWGTQYTHLPEPVQRTVSRRLSRAGADLVVGGHPHWVQGVEMIGETLVAHSLGNFVFDMDFMTQTQQGVLLETTWWGDQLKSVDPVPYRMHAGFAPRPVRGAEADAILADVWRASSGPFRDAG